MREHTILCKGQHQVSFLQKVVLLAVCCKCSTLWHHHTWLGCITEFHLNSLNITETLFAQMLNKNSNI